MKLLLPALTALMFSLSSMLVAQNPDRFESEIRGFEAADSTNPPPAKPILFVGSSTFRLWKKLPAEFPGLPILNRGFGGSHQSDVNAFFDRVVARYKPSRIVVYAGDNDLAGGKSADTVLADFSSFVARVRKELGDTPIAFVYIKPSPSRLALLHEQRRANRLVTAFAAEQKNVDVIDFWAPMLDRLQAPKADLFRDDKLHLNDAGYAILREAVSGYFKSKGVSP